MEQTVEMVGVAMMMTMTSVVTFVMMELNGAQLMKIAVQTVPSQISAIWVPSKRS